MFDGVLQNSEALLTPLIAVIAVYIAWQQAATNKARLKHELFEKRFDIYSKFKAVFIQINESAKIDQHQVESFLVDTLEVEFLFGTKISGFRDEVVDRAFDVSMGLHNRDSLKADAEQIKQGDEQYRYGVRWFVENTQELLKVFKPYLELK